MSMMNVPDEIHEQIKKLQHGLKFRYRKTVSQIQILLHINSEEVKPENYDETVDSLYIRLTKNEEKKKEVEVG